MSKPIPDYVQKYFWGDDLNELDFGVHKKYITEVVLDKGDDRAVKWLFGNISKSEVVDMLGGLNLSDRSRNFWEIYLGFTR